MSPRRRVSFPDIPASSWSCAAASGADDIPAAVPTPVNNEAGEDILFQDVIETVMEPVHAQEKGVNGLAEMCAGDDKAAGLLENALANVAKEQKVKQQQEFDDSLTPQETKIRDAIKKGAFDIRDAFGANVCTQRRQAP